MIRRRRWATLSPPLQCEAALANAAKDYAETCNLGVHAAPHENLATALQFRTINGVTTDLIPAGSDSTAFTNTWACEERFYRYNDPKICGGFKNKCDEPEAECNGNPVTGHSSGSPLPKWDVGARRAP
jgi:hypothetical protein